MSIAYQFSLDANVTNPDAWHWALSLVPDGRVDHLRWEKTRGDEYETDAEKRMADEAPGRGADMKAWWSEWFERSDVWRDEIGHDRDEPVEELSESPAP